MKSKIGVIIIDDEKLARDIVKNYLKANNKFEVLAEAQNGFEGIKAINEFNPDLIFLDIQMPKISGFELLEVIDDPPEIIFTTAFDQYALKAFEVNALDYLLKPFSEHRFNEALKKVENTLKSSSESHDSVKKLVEQIQDEVEYLNRVIVKKNNNIVILPVEKIKFIEAQDDYISIHSEQGIFLKSQTMKYFEEHLDPSEFIRIHRSYIVRIREIKQLEPYEKESYKVLLNSGEKLSVSKSGYSRLKEILK